MDTVAIDNDSGRGRIGIKRYINFYSKKNGFFPPPRADGAGRPSLLSFSLPPCRDSYRDEGRAPRRRRSPSPWGPGRAGGGAALPAAGGAGHGAGPEPRRAACRRGLIPTEQRRGSEGARRDWSAEALTSAVWPLPPLENCAGSRPAL